MAKRRSIVAFMVAAVVSGFVQGGGATAVAAPAELPDEASASAAAGRFDRQVEVAGLKSETSQVFANPSGTFTAVVNARPVRVRLPGGAWAPVDTTLRRDAGGRVSATMSSLRATLSGGGTGPLFASGDRVLTWPRTLPVPVLDGNTAVYREALPGVDLAATLDVGGVVTALSVKSREAAGSAELATAVRTLSPVPDSDLARLTAADAVYPAVVAPATTVGAANWTMINERHPDQSYWSYDRGEGAKVGYVEQSGDGWERYRSIWTFPMENLRGKHVLRAWFSSYLKHTYSCSDTWTDLYLVNSVNAGTTWANHWGSWPWSSYLAGANNSDCRDAGRYSEWGGDKVTKAAQDGTGWGTLTLGLRAGDEGTINTGWKKFDENRTALSIEYNSYPRLPTSSASKARRVAHSRSTSARRARRCVPVPATRTARSTTPTSPAASASRPEAGSSPGNRRSSPVSPPEPSPSTAWRVRWPTGSSMPSTASPTTASTPVRSPRTASSTST
ncbi:hypothetical protein [Amycolatopsis sp. EV170708-02-1]|uniref:hypothetical protein n=1 Tax=Amycolatopsis sp. EV170708-02-1 TaxID=2919322 RepID=UPI001F0BB799|nr:hypothetical protein [Amycolatopsis sp. EV170708-02-1]UMP00023.1 hypothetical protein MJQ72_26335 [Amycolatopsis sp. EV170708-02-1]